MKGYLLIEKNVGESIVVSLR